VLAYTFGQGLATAALVVFLFVCALVAIRVVRRDDIGVPGKAIWIAVMLVIPLGGLLAYFLWDASRARTT
jgi:hypothetical protein